MQPQNAIIGEGAYGTEVPKTNTPDPQMAELQRAAKFAKSKEFADQKRYLESKITYYQKWLPGEVPPENVPATERGQYWAVANVLIREFQAFINVYEQAAQMVAEEIAKQNAAR